MVAHTINFPLDFDFKKNFFLCCECQGTEGFKNARGGSSTAARQAGIAAAQVRFL